MITDFFTGYGNRVSFSSSLELNDIFSHIDSRVIKYHNIERERYYIIHYIPTLVNNDLLQFPLSVEFLDNGIASFMPDFLINCNNEKIILEATMATTRECMMLREKFKDITLTETFLWIDNGIPRMSVRDATNGLFGPPANLMIAAEIFGILTSYFILKKTKKLQSYVAVNNCSKELLVYYNFPTYGNLLIEKALNFTYEKLQTHDYNNFPVKFDKIHIMRDRYIIYDVMSKNIKILEI